MAELKELADEIARFRDARNWAQFHTPRNLAAALSIEVAELQETMLWKSEDDVASMLDDPASKEHMRQEIADIAIYLFLLAGATGIELASAIRSKLALNAQKYPVDRARGSSAKYTEL